MKKFLGKILLEDLKNIDQCDFSTYHGTDKNSFQQGYADGFIKGFFLSYRWFIAVLVLSLALNIIQYIH